MPKTAIIIPCFNEEKRLDKLKVKELSKLYNIDIYFTNDGSTDKTQQLINEICLLIPNCFSINYNKNEGKSAAIYKSINEINVKNKYDYIGYFDADFSTPSKQLVNMINYIETNNSAFIFASRIKTLNALIVRKTHRHIIGRTILTIINLKHRLNIYDTQCGCKIFSKNIINEGFKDPFRTKWLFDVEVFIRLKNKQLLHSGIEFPIYQWTDVEGSKLKMSHFPKIMKELITLYKI